MLQAGEVEVLKEQISQRDTEHAAAVAELQREVDEVKNKFQEEEKKNFAMEADRRKLQNTIQELRGNVRVFARLRPFLPSDHEEPDATACIGTCPRGELVTLVTFGTLA